MKKIDNVVYNMLVENTGASICDSGGAYGRHHQKNAQKTLADFQKEPAVSYDIDRAENSKEIEYTISVYHYITSGGLSIDDTAEEYNLLPCDDWESDIYGVSKAQKEWLDAHGFTVLENSFNTYNDEGNLSQVLQGTYITTDGTNIADYVLLQVHGGCDVRGGYTNAKMFKLENGGYMPQESVYGTVTTDGIEYGVSDGYNGYSLTSDNNETIEDGEPVPINSDSIISLYLSEY